MNTPGFTAEASIYKTNTAYLGAYGSFISDGSKAVIPQQLSCEGRCGLAYGACLIGCVSSGSGWCGAGCYATFLACIVGCPTEGGRGPGGPGLGAGPRGSGAGGVTEPPIRQL